MPPSQFFRSARVWPRATYLATVSAAGANEVKTKTTIAVRISRRFGGGNINVLRLWLQLLQNGLVACPLRETVGRQFESAVVGLEGPATIPLFEQGVAQVVVSFGVFRV